MVINSGLGFTKLTVKKLILLLIKLLILGDDVLQHHRLLVDLVNNRLVDTVILPFSLLSLNQLVHNFMPGDQAMVCCIAYQLGSSSIFSLETLHS